MTREEFIRVLEEKGYSYELEGNKIVVYHRGDVSLESLKTIPPGVVFNNGEDAFLNSLVTLPPGVVFRNEGDVYFGALKTIPPGVEFKNGGHVKFRSLIGGWLEYWSGNIEGVDNKRLLNLMISKGMFI